MLLKTQVIQKYTDVEDRSLPHHPTSLPSFPPSFFFEVAITFGILSFLTLCLPPTHYFSTLPVPNTLSLETSDERSTRKNEKLRNHSLTNLMPTALKKKKKKVMPLRCIMYTFLGANLFYNLNIARRLAKTPGRRKYQTD